jgi:hypothetical protein
MEVMLLLHDIDNIAQSFALLNVKIFYHLTVLALLADWESWILHSSISGILPVSGSFERMSGCHLFQCPPNFGAASPHL